MISVVTKTVVVVVRVSVVRGERWARRGPRLGWR